MGGEADMGSRSRILIVEDGRIVATDTKRTLESLGYAVSAIASSGEDALSKAEETRPDLVLIDIVLNGDIDGTEAAQQIRR